MNSTETWGYDPTQAFLFLMIISFMLGFAIGILVGWKHDAGSNQED